MPKGRPPKPDDRRQRTHERETLPAVPDEERADELTIPEPPSGMLAATRKRWQDLWSSELAKTIALTDMPALERLFTLYDERDRAMRDFRKQRMVRGSQGQQVLNPLGRLFKDLDAEIRQLEDRFGLSPQARLRLGIDLGRAAGSLADLNAKYRAAESGNAADGAESGNDPQPHPDEVEGAGELVGEDDDDDADDPRLD